MQKIQINGNNNIDLTGDIDQEIISDAGNVCLGFSDGTLIEAQFTTQWNFEVLFAGPNSKITPQINGIIINTPTPIIWLTSGNGTANEEFMPPDNGDVETTTTTVVEEEEETFTSGIGIVL